MSLKEIVIALCGAAVLVGAIVGAMILVLEVYPRSSSDEPHKRYDCTEEDFRGVCGIRKFFSGEQ